MREASHRAHHRPVTLAITMLLPVMLCGAMLPCAHRALAQVGDADTTAVATSGEAPANVTSPGTAPAITAPAVTSPAVTSPAVTSPEASAPVTTTPAGATTYALTPRPEPFWPAPLTVETGFIYRTWNIAEPDGDSDIDQLSWPVWVHGQLSNDLQLSYLFNVASSELGFETGGTNQLAGVTDGKLGIDYRLPDPRLSVGAAVRVPTGQSVLTPEEDNVARIILDRMLGFYVRRYGEGTDFELRTGYAGTQSPRLTLAGGFSYVFKGSFDVRNPAGGPLSSYDPGNELGLYGSARMRVAAGHLDARLQFVDFARDRRDGRDELEEGRQFALTGVLTQEVIGGVARLEVTGLWKADTVVYSGGQRSQPLRDVGGNILRVNTDFSGRLTRRLTLGGLLGLAWFGETDAGTGDGFLLELGPNASYSLIPGLRLRADWILMSGNSEQGTIDLRGQAIAVALALGDGP